uniref:Uncharacterized protein AlNc14C28G2674 n=1 Tax=Albugo laibachii Nc14 TaxID=890382 RepID=F0W745_9STRA|nr:conserved unknown protein putative [Albugo laibachii Nc14]|eukprot:CCA16944.1 conserved unknown protein putative [Albugo laibachii Nc14]
MKVHQVTVEGDHEAPRSPRLIHLSFECDWSVGIGGSVWTSGEILASYFKCHRDRLKTLFHGKRIVELGSGTGIVGLTCAACFQPSHVILTDLPSQLDSLRNNVIRNQEQISGVSVAELEWGNAEHIDAVCARMDVDLSTGKPFPVDVILGTDVAYIEEAYEPLTSTLDHLAHQQTLILLVINRMDTKLKFFDRLEHLGFGYYKVSDGYLSTECRGKDFAIFEIKRVKGFETK